MFISPSLQEWPKRADKASLLTASGMLSHAFPSIFVSRVWRYQRGNQNQYIEEEQTTQWSNEKVQKDK